MNCLDTKHHYRLVGYRDRRPKEVGADDQDGFCLMDAMMACTKCLAVKTVGVTRQVPVKVIGGTRRTDRP